MRWSGLKAFARGSDLGERQPSHGRPLNRFLKLGSSLLSLLCDFWSRSNPHLHPWQRFGFRRLPSFSGNRSVTAV